MNKTLKSTLSFSSILLVYLFVFLTPSMLMPVSDKLLKIIDPDEMKFFFPLLLLLAFYISLTYWLVIKNTDEKRMTVFWKLELANFIIFPLMGLLESLFWIEAFKEIESVEFLNIFYRVTLTFSLFSAFLAIIRNNSGLIEGSKKSTDGYKKVAQKIIVISIAYFFIYNFFGYFVAWQFEATRVFYSGSSEIKGFFSAMIQNISDPIFVLVHIFRGMLFGFAGYIFYTLLNCSRTKTIIIMAMIFGGFGFQIILPNPIFPTLVRISHFLETTISMLFFGGLVGYVFSYKSIRKDVIK